MNKIIFRLKDKAGMSILEVLVALFLAGIVTAAIFQIYITQHKNWMIQEDITDIQQNARAAIDELNRNIRMAGYGLPSGMIPIVAYDTNPDTIIINFSRTRCSAPLEEAMPMPSSELKCDGNDISCFHDGDWVYICHPGTGDGEYFEITEVQVAAAHIQHNTMPLSKIYNKGAAVVQLDRIKYYIDYSDSLHPNLMMQVSLQSPQVYAENIYDLQFRYTMKNGTTTDAPVISSNIREVEISLSARSSKPDLDFPDNPYRRRTYSSKVNLRNLDI